MLVIAISLWTGLLLCLPAGAAPMVFTLNTSEPRKPEDVTFMHSVLMLALQKTQATWGDFRIQYAPGMTTTRALKELQSDRGDNLVILTTFQNHYLAQGLDYARIPLDLGLTGYRLCFSSPNTHRVLRKGVSRASLQRLKIAQGLGWTDVAVLRKNGFNAVEVDSVRNIFDMLAHERVQLFCRGMNEIGPAVRDAAQEAGIQQEQGFALQYDLPRFFFFNKKNHQARLRVEQGLRMAHADGSLLAVQTHFFRAAVHDAHITQRQIFRLKSSGIDGVDVDYKKYQNPALWSGW